MYARKTMLVKIFSLFACVTLITGCSSNNPEIRALCLRDDIGNYILKWETEPQMEGILKMYVSDDPESFNRSLPAGYATIKRPAGDRYSVPDNSAP